MTTSANNQPEKAAKAQQKRLIDAGQNERLLDEIYDQIMAGSAARNNLPELLSRLAKAGKIDVIGAYEHLKNEGQSGPDFFPMTHVFEKVLPHLDSPLEQIMQCVLHLKNEAGEDLSAGQILHSYSSYCENNNARPYEALRLIEENEDYIDLLALTLIAGAKIDSKHFTKEALRFLSLGGARIRRLSAFALGKFPWSKKNGPPSNVLTSLKKAALQKSDSQLAGAAIRSLYELLSCDGVAEAPIWKVIDKSLASSNAYTVHAAAEIFGFRTHTISNRGLEVLTRHLVHVSPENTGTIRNIDFGIYALLKGKNRDLGLDLLQKLLLEQSPRLSIDTFASSVSEITSDVSLLATLTTKWLVTGRLELCQAVEMIFQSSRPVDFELSVDTNQIPSNNGRLIIFLARKIIGYLFIFPGCVASLIVSLMRHAEDEDVIDILAAHIFDPLLINYTGSTREYLREVAKSEPDGKVKSALEGALDKIQQYLDALHSIDTVAELIPPEENRQAYNRRFSAKMAESFKQAQERSVLLSVATRVVILHGRRSINYSSPLGGEEVRSEIGLHEHSVSMELPRRDTLDPFGLDYTLRTFRGERLS